MTARGWREDIGSKHATFSFREGKLKSGIVLVLIGALFTLLGIVVVTRAVADHEWLAAVALIAAFFVIPVFLLVGGLIALFNRVQIAITSTAFVQTSGPILRTTRTLTLAEAKTIMIRSREGRRSTTMYFTAMMTTTMKQVRLPGDVSAFGDPTLLLEKIVDAIQMIEGSAELPQK